MLSMYERVALACKEKGFTPGYMCDQLGLHRGFLTELKSGRTKSLSCAKVQAISEFTGCSCDWIITGQEYKGNLTDEERSLLSAFRTAPLSERETVKFVLRNYMPVPQDKAQESAG